MTQDTPLPDHDALPPGTRLGEFEIQRVLGVGGFGIVYLAFDHALERLVALKEYMPQALAARGQGASVSIRSTSHVETFGVGLRSFVNEAKLLARFDHPSLVKVYRFWEDNGTAYMVMPYYQGSTLRDVRKSLPQPPSEAWLRDLLDPLLGALDVLHKEQVYHRDIAPDNIVLLASGQPVLLDFGAARRVIGDRTQTLTAILKPNFAPIEQYAETAGLRQGPWTDLYALGAVVHFCLTGKPPTPAAARAVHDELPSVSSIAATLAGEAHLHYGDAFATAIDACLAVRPQGRPANVAALRALLRGESGAPVAAAPAAPAAGPQAYAPTQPYLAGGKSPAPGDTTQSYAPTQQAPRPQRGRPQAAVDPVALASARVPKAKLRRHWLMAAVGVVPIVFAGLLWYVTSKPAGQAVEPATAASAPAAAASSQLAAASLPAAAPASAADSAASAMATAPAAVPQPTASAGATPAAAVVAAAVPTPRPRPKPTPEPAAAAAEVREAPTPTHVPAPTQAAQRRPVAEAPATKTAAAAAVPAPQQPAPVPARDPREACGGRVFLALYQCLKRECVKPEYAKHKQCRRVREQEELNERNYQQ